MNHSTLAILFGCLQTSWYSKMLILWVQDLLVLSFHFTNIMSNTCVVIDLRFKNFIDSKTNKNDFCLHL